MTLTPLIIFDIEILLLHIGFIYYSDYALRPALALVSESALFVRGAI
jgi:hypothetical protein